jgi:hypothetical protein
MTFAAAFLCLSLFTHCEQIRIMFPTEKHEKLGGKTSFQTIVGVIWRRQKLIVKRNKILIENKWFSTLETEI